MKSTPRIILLTLFITLGCFTGISVAQAGDGAETPGDILNNFSDVLIYMAPSVAFGMTLMEEDTTGMKQFAESMVVTMGICTGFKYTVHSRRPDGNPQSFPSGHTAIVVQSAEFMRKRYGWKFGLPVYAVAGYVGYMRATSGAHHTRDVLAGALIGFVSTYLITKPYEGWNVQPVVGSAYLGVNLSRAW
jgi:membrane-associated phospholipid phosphatase